MSTENTETESQDIHHDILPGEILRQRREELGLSQKDISERLRLKISVIENIENNQFDSHHVATFIRGYFRSYAKAVGIKEKEILAALDRSGRGQHKEQPMHSFSQKTQKQQHDNRIMRLTWGILIIILGISSIWWWQNHQLDTLSPSALISSDETNTDNMESDNSPVAERVDQDFETLETAIEPSEQAPSLDENEQEAPEQSPVASDDVEADAPVATTSDLPAVSSVEPSETETQVVAEITEPVNSENTLAMQFKDDCWIQVKDQSGAVLATGLKKAGESLTLTGEAPYSIILGAPEGVSISLADEPIDLSGYTPGKVARLTLP